MKYRRILAGVLLAALALLAGLLLFDRQQTAVQRYTAFRSVETAKTNDGEPTASGTPHGDDARSQRRPGFKPDRPALAGQTVAYRFAFAGNRSFSASVLVSVLRLIAQPDDEDALADGIRRDLKDFYLSHGFVHFKVVDLDIDLGSPTQVFCEVSEGPQFTFGRIKTLTSDEGISNAFEEAAPVGSPANLVLMKRLSRQLAEQYQGNGYLDFKTSVEFGLAAETLDFTVKVDTGQRYVIGRVSVPAAMPELQPLQALSSQPFSRSVLEYYLDKAGLPWEAVRLQRDSWDAVVDIEINPKIEESGR